MAGRTAATELRQIVGRNARKIRLKKGASLEDMEAAAKRNGLSWSTGRVGDLEHGRVNLTLEMLVSVALALGEIRQTPVRLDELLSFDHPVMVNGREIRSLPDVVRGVPIHLTEDQIKADMQTVEKHCPTLSERRAAKRLGVSTARLSDLSHQMWGTEFEQERNERVGSLGTTVERGAATRDMLEDISELIDAGY